jgi:hypothetical protein
VVCYLKAGLAHVAGGEVIPGVVNVIDLRLEPFQVPGPPAIFWGCRVIHLPSDSLSGSTRFVASKSQPPDSPFT